MVAQQASGCLVAERQKIRVMVSSRSEVKVFDTGERLRDVRLRLQKFLDLIRWCSAGELIGRDEPIFNVWIYEDEPGEDAGKSTFQISLDQINRADVVLVLYTGEAGSLSSGSSLGICHAELQTAVSRRPEIVFMVRLLPLKKTPGKSDREFQNYVMSLSLFQKDAHNEAQLRAVVAEMMQNVVARLAARARQPGHASSIAARPFNGIRLNLADRRAKMRAALAGHLDAVSLSDVGEQPLFSIALPGIDLLVRLDAIPAAASEPAAREMVGQPFLRDHMLAGVLTTKDLIGPVDIVACHRTVTESQATRIIGTPDCMIVASDFGIYAADHAQKIQVAFLAHCSDDTATAVVVRRFREWLEHSGEREMLIERARSRRRIIETVAEELHSPKLVRTKPPRSNRQKK